MTKVLSVLIVLLICGVLGSYLFRSGDQAPKSTPEPTLVETNALSLETKKVVEVFAESYPERSSDHPIRFYRMASPRCAFVEVGEVRATVRWAADEAGTRRVLKQGIEDLARSIGGDGVGALNQFTQTRVYGGSGVPAEGTRYLSWSATVFRFVDPDCTE